MIAVVMVLLRYRDPAIGALLDDSLAALAATPGFVSGWVGRSPDDADLWVLSARWSEAGAMRHGLGSFPVKMALGPLQAFSAGQDVVVEVLTDHDGVSARSTSSDLAPDAAQVAPRSAGEPS